MAQKRKHEQRIIEKPVGELVKQFSACGNYPVETAGVEALAKALERAAMDTGIRMQAIVDDCLSNTAWCPTPFDLRQTAVQMRDKARSMREGSKHSEWRQQYGEPDPNWASDFIREAMNAGGYKKERDAIRDEAIRSMLFYTEGEGKLLGDRDFWEGRHGARWFHLKHNRDHVDRIRDEGGWFAERELQRYPEVIQ